jgi:hypothetical protein
VDENEFPFSLLILRRGLCVFIRFIRTNFHDLEPWYTWAKRCTIPAQERGRQVSQAGVMVYIKVNGIWKELFLSILNYCCVGDICLVSATTTTGYDCTD